MSFVFDEKDLPEVVEDITYSLNEDVYGADAQVTYFNVGGWSMSSLPDEDANLSYAREAALAWIAWCDFLEANPEKFTKNADNKVNDVDVITSEG